MKTSLRSDERGRNTWRAVECQWKRTFQGGNCPIRLEFPGAQETVGGVVRKLDWYEVLCSAAD